MTRWPNVFSPSAFDYKVGIARIHRLLGLLEACYARAPRALGEMPLEFLECDFVTYGIDLDAAAPQVLDVPADAELVGPLLGKISVTDTLDST